ncbi:hypothetical protein ANTPLA_LOCUS6254 [Anthophora plagiata]
MIHPLDRSLKIDENTSRLYNNNNNSNNNSSSRKKRRRRRKQEKKKKKKKKKKEKKKYKGNNGSGCSVIAMTLVTLPRLLVSPFTVKETISIAIVYRHMIL